MTFFECYFFQNSLKPGYNEFSNCTCQCSVVSMKHSSIASTRSPAHVSMTSDDCGRFGHVSATINGVVHCDGDVAAPGLLQRSPRRPFFVDLHHSSTYVYSAAVLLARSRLPVIHQSSCTAIALAASQGPHGLLKLQDRTTTWQDCKITDRNWTERKTTPIMFF